MNIAFFSDSYLPQVNGVVTQIRNISKELANHGHRVLIVAPSENSKFKFTEENGISAIFMPSFSLPTYPDYRISLPHSSRVEKRISAFKPDIVHIHTPFGVGWFGVNFAHKHKIPLIGTYHTLLPEFLVYLPLPFLGKTNWAKKTTWQYTNYFYSKCDLVSVPTSKMKNELEKNGFKREVAVLPNAIDFGLFNSAIVKKKKSKNLKLIYFGRVSYEKNIEVLFFALKHLISKNIRVELSITGSGPALNYLKKIANENKINSHVHFHKLMSPKDLSKHVASHDIFLTASTIETQGLTILESMAAGLPCIGADYMAIPDSIDDGLNGFLFAPYDFISLAKKIEKLRSVPLRKKMGKNACKTAGQYSVEKIVKKTVALYAKVIFGKN